MKKFQIFSLALIAVLTLTACQPAVSNETPPTEAEAVQAESSEATSDKTETVEATEAATESTADAASEVATEVTTEATTTETKTETTTETSEEANNDADESSEEVARFPVRDEKIPPYEIALRDGSTIKLDQFEGKVVVMTFFTTW